MEQSSTRTAGCDDSKGGLPCSILHASWPPARRCPTCGTAEVRRPNACSTQSCLGTPEMLAFTGRVGCGCCQSRSRLPSSRPAHRPSAHLARPGSLRAEHHASAPGPLRSQTVTRSFFTVCSACASLSGSFSFQQSATVVCGLRAPSQSALSRPRFSFLL